VWQHLERWVPGVRNDVIAVVGGLALYALFVSGLHQRLFGVAIVG